MFRPYMAIIRFCQISLYKLREMRYDVEISHQIIVPMHLCIGGYCATLIYSVPPVVQGLILGVSNLKSASLSSRRLLLLTTLPPI